MAMPKTPIKKKAPAQSAPKAKVPAPKKMNDPRVLVAGKKAKSKMC